MADIKVTSEELHRVSSQLDTGSQDIAQRMASMRSLVESVIGAGWSGAASQSFNDLYAQWNDAGQRLQESLTGISTQLEHAAQGYEQTEQSIAAGFRS